MNSRIASNFEATRHLLHQSEALLLSIKPVFAMPFLKGLPSLFAKKWTRRVLIENFRRWGLLKPLEVFDSLTCKKAAEINAQNIDAILGDYINIQTDIEIEQTNINPGVCYGDDQLNGLRNFKQSSIEVILLDIKNPALSFRNNHLLDGRLNIIVETRNDFINQIAPFRIYWRHLESCKKLKGSVAYLADSDPKNYYHWLCRTLPLLEYYDRKWGLNKIDFFYIGQFSLRDFHRETLEKVGIPPQKLIQNACRADRLLVGIMNRTTDCGESLSHRAYQYSRSLFLDSRAAFPKAKRRLYIQRGNTSRRKVLNEAEVISLLERYGFEIIEMDGRTIAQQVDLFLNAEVIVAAHGAALTNLLFIQPNTTVIELMPYGYVQNCFQILASYGQANYFCLQSERTCSDSTNWRSIDLQIDIQKLNALCQTLF